MAHVHSQTQYWNAHTVHTVHSYSMHTHDTAFSQDSCNTAQPGTSRRFSRDDVLLMESVTHTTSIGADLYSYLLQRAVPSN